VPRGSSSKKRKSTGSDNSEVLEKKIKIDDTDETNGADMLPGTLLSPNDGDGAHNHKQPGPPQANMLGNMSVDTLGVPHSAGTTAGSTTENVLQSTEAAHHEAFGEAAENNHVKDAAANGNGAPTPTMLPSTVNGLAANGASPARNLDGSARRNSSVLVSPAETSPPVMNGTTSSHEATTPVHRRHSSRQSRPVDRFISEVQVATPSVTKSQKTTFENGQGKSGSPERRRTPATPASAKARATSTQTSPAARAASASATKQRTKSFSVKPPGKTPTRETPVVEKKEETAEERDLRVAMELQAQEFGLRRRSR
jgi:hypothetical protein